MFPGVLKNFSQIIHLKHNRIYLLLSFALFALNVVAMSFHYDYGSDGTAQQVIIGIWRQGFHHIARVGSDSFILKFPLYYLTQITLPWPRIALLMQSFVLDVGAFGLFAVAARYFWRLQAPKGRVPTALVLVWLATLGPTLLVYLFIPNGRNLEIGLGFVVLMLAAKYVRGDFAFGGWRGRAVAVLAVVAGGVFIYNDPLVLYYIAAPLVLLALWWMIWHRAVDPRLMWVVTAVAGSFAVGKLLDLLLIRVGFVATSASPTFVSVERLQNNLQIMLGGGLDLFHASIFGAPVYSLTTLAALAALPLLGWVAFYIYRQLRQPHEFWLLLICLLPPVILVVFLLSGYVDFMGATRYLSYLPFAVALAAGCCYQSLSTETQRRWFGGLLLANCVVGLSLFGQTVYLHETRDPNALNKYIIGVVQQRGLSKGYADYWQANINTYLSGNRINFISAVCDGTRLHKETWLTDDGIVQRTAKKSFYLYDASLDGTAQCSYDKVVDQLGAPNEDIAINGSIHLFVFPYDISSKL